MPTKQVKLIKKEIEDVLGLLETQKMVIKQAQKHLIQLLAKITKEDR